jgi:hypothetical protein
MIVPGARVRILAQVTAAPARDLAQLVVFACQNGLAIPGTSAGPAH